MSNSNFVNRLVHILRSMPTLPDNAQYVHAAVLEAMNADGLLVLPEYWIRFGEEQWGRIDLVVKDRNLSAAIELDCRRPRGKSLLKQRAFNGARILGLRGIAGRVDLEGIDAVVPIRVRLESIAEEKDKAAVGRAYDRIRGRS